MCLNFCSINTTTYIVSQSAAIDHFFIYGVVFYCHFICIVIFDYMENILFL